MATNDHDESESVSEVRNLFADLQETDISAARLVTEAIEHVKGKQYLTEFGALSDVLTPRESETEARRQAQVLSSTLPI